MSADSFTTIELTRNEAGFESNINIDDSTHIEPCVSSANAEVLSAVAFRYSLPLASVNYTGSPAEAFLKKLATVIAACRLNLAQYEGQGGSLEGSISSRLKNSMDDLAKIRMGTIRLIGADGAELPLTSTGANMFSSFPKNSDLDNPTDPTHVQTKFTINQNF